jgi:hypothetical protein
MQSDKLTATTLSGEPRVLKPNQSRLAGALQQRAELCAWLVLTGAAVAAEEMSERHARRARFS